MTTTRAARLPWFRDRWRWPRWRTRDLYFMSERPWWSLQRSRRAALVPSGMYVCNRRCINIKTRRTWSHLV